MWPLDAADEVEESRNQPTLNLHALTANHRADRHSLYSDELIALLRDDARRSTALNIALTGGYGSGKSSVLAKVRSALPGRTVEISLSSLSESGVHTQGADEDLSAYIQKEIVKQLLYREAPSKVPGSRYKRVSRLPKFRTAVASLMVGLILAAVVWVAGWAPPESPFAAWPARGWFLLACAGAGSLATFLTLSLLHNRVRVEKLGTASTSVSMVANVEGTYFDEYLDEIVYVFEMTKRDIVIIEDLDRFEDPSIYAALRALNTVLNSSRQLRRRPVHFIYAVRDSIFEDLRKAATTEDEAHGGAGGGKPVEMEQDFVWQSRLDLSDAATQRAKFFDLVVPIVPFITHRTAADLLASVMNPVDNVMPTDVFRVVGRHVTDMRLLHNIVNEYRVFRARLIEGGGLSGLQPAVLFGMVAYKNTHLADFELVRVGQSRLDKLYREFRQTVDASVEMVLSEIEEIESEPLGVPFPNTRAEELSQHLVAFSSRWAERLGVQHTQVRIRRRGVEASAADLQAAPFWSDVIDDGTAVEIWGPSGELFRIDAGGLRAEWGDLVPLRWKQAEAEDRTAKLESLRAEAQSIRAADLGSLAMVPRTVDRSGDAVDYRAAIKRHLGNPLLVDLVLDGHIDQNFALYASEFYGVSLTANAMNFVIQHVQTEIPSHEYELNPSEVASVLEAAGPTVFTSTGLYNGSVYDALLPMDRRLRKNVSQLRNERPVDHEFIEWYLVRGHQREKFAAVLAGEWSGVFDAIDRVSRTDGERWRLANQALRGATTHLDYVLPTSVARLFTLRANTLRELVNDSPGTPGVVRVLGHLGVSLDSLEGVGADALRRITEAGIYRLTPDNLRAAAALQDGSPVGLDTLLEVSATTFSHAISNLDSYLDCLASESGMHSLDTGARMVEILNHAEAAMTGGAASVLRQAAPGVHAESLEAADLAVMEALAATHRFKLTFANLTKYEDEVGVDEALLNVLEERGAILDPSDDRGLVNSMAIRLVNEDRLSVESRVSLLRSLAPDALTPNRISSLSDGLIYELTRENLIDQSGNSFNALARSLQSQVELVLGSTDPMSYVPFVILSAEVVAGLLREPGLQSDVRDWLIDRVSQESSWWTGDVLEAVAESLSREPRPTDGELARVAVSSDLSPTASMVVLASSAAQLPIGELLDLVGRLPQPYSELANAEGAQFELPSDPDLTPLLQVLTGATVSTWTQADGLFRIRRSQ